MLLTLSSIFAFIAAIIVILGLFWGLKLASHSKDGILKYYFYAIIFSNGMIILMSSRTFGAEDFIGGSGPGESFIATWAIRLASLFTMLAALERTLNFTLHHKLSLNRAIFLFVLIYLWIATIFVPTFITSDKMLPLQYFYSLAFSIGVVLTVQTNHTDMIKHARTAIVSFVMVSLICILIMPSHVLDLSYSQGYIPGLPRFYGLTPHATRMGTLSAIAIWLMLAYPYKSKKLNNTLIMLCLIALILSQAKTVLLTFLIGFIIISYFKQHKTNERGSKFSFNWPKILVRLSLGAVFLITFTLTTTITIFGTEHLLSLFDPNTLDKLTSFTGRDVLWKAAMDEFYKNPIFGYGINIFDLGYRIEIGFMEAVHGHNQFIDSLARGGLISFSAFLILYVYLIIYSIKLARKTNGLSIAIIVLLLLTSITEIPINMTSISINNVVFFLLLIIIATHIDNKKENSSQKNIKRARKAY